MFVLYSNCKSPRTLHLVSTVEKLCLARAVWKPSVALLGVALYTLERVKPQSHTNCQGGFLGGENKGLPLSAPGSPRIVVPTLSPKPNCPVSSPSPSHQGQLPACLFLHSPPPLKCCHPRVAGSLHRIEFCAIWLHGRVLWSLTLWKTFWNFARNRLKSQQA